MAEQKLIKLKINEREVQVPQGTLVIEATRRMGTEVPSFCYYPGLSLQAACRMCLVEVEKAPKLQTACTLVAMEGMIVRTDTEQVRQARKYMLEFLLTNHPLDCPVCDKGGECELQDMVFRYGADSSRFVEEKIHRPEEKWSELVYYDAPRCILCFRCVRVCDEGMDVKALGVGMRGANSVIIPNRGDHLECEECGMCIDICPVGALTSGTYRYKTRPWEMAYVSTVCTHCSIGCIGSNRTSNEENYLLQKLARTTLGTNNIDHHRTADYTGLITALGERAGDSLLTMEQLYQSKAVLLVGNDPTNQNPLAGWQIRSGIRHHGTKLFIINANEIRLKRKATQFVKVTAGQAAAALRWLAHEEGQLSPAVVEQLVQLKAGLEAESDVAVVFGAEVSGAAIAPLVTFGSKLPGKTRYLALGDYANSRGAADMGVLPDRLPGYAYVGNPQAHEAFEKLWGCGAIPTKPGLTTPQMVKAAQAGKLKALYVVGANPLAHFGRLGFGRGQL